MNSVKLSTILMILILSTTLFILGCGQDNNNDKDNMDGIIWHGQSTIQINSLDKVLYFDPFNMGTGLEKADFIVITHAHYDHCSFKDILKVSKPETILFATPDCLSELENLDIAKKIAIIPHQNYAIEGYEDFSLTTIPAYNIERKFHPKGKKWIGAIAHFNNKRYYHAGDTDAIPEMSLLKGIDVAFLPIGGTYTMDAKEAAVATKMFNPKKVIPIHYGSIVGNKEDAVVFENLCGCEVDILEN
ncbi:MBL fold metallo-hydrolase [Candidatus Woesearchaeota archaeon]|nr:MBL fold metallo-hydrolase [Candidatus Woesearchaeota archaeon]MBT6336690.1 MBL fold metallo-hydrolase [Candidatus Woesearchaeota archaeon]